MKKLFWSQDKDYYVLWLDSDDIPKGILTGPFSTVDQAKTAMIALEPLFVGKRLSIGWRKSIENTSLIIQRCLVDIIFLIRPTLSQSFQ